MVNKRDVSKIEGLLYIYELANNKSKRDAVKKIGTTSDTLNKYIANFEAEMNTIYVDSTKKGTTLTPDGREILKKAAVVAEVLRSLNEGAAAASAFKGTVRLGLTDAISEFLGLGSMFDFFEKYPEIKVESHIGNSMPDMSALEVDIGIYYDHPDQECLELISAKSSKCGLFASQLYIDTYGQPKNWDDLLQNHKLCDKFNHQYYVDRWKDIVEKANLVYTTNSIYSFHGAIAAGIGIGICPLVYGNEHFVRLTKIDFEFEVMIYLIAHRETKNTPRIKVLLDCLREQLDLRCSA